MFGISTLLAHPFLTLIGLVVAWVLYKLLSPLWTRFGLPPGPTPLPLAGNLLLFKGTTAPMADTLRKMGTSFGDAFTIWMGPVPIIFLNNLEAVERYLLNKPNDIASRPQLLQGDVVVQGYPDIIFSEYDERFRSNRKVAARVLQKVLGSGKLESIIRETASDLTKLLRAIPPNTPVEMGNYVSSLVFSTIGALCYGRKFAFDDPEFLAMMKIFEIEEGYQEEAFSLEMIPKVRNLYWLLKHFSPIKDAIEVSAKDKKFALQQYEEHARTYKERTSYEGKHNDILDAVIAENDTGRDTDKLAVMIVRDLFAAGYQTTQRTLRWFVLEMALNPEIQEDIADQIRRNIGDQNPSLVDRPKLPLVEAAIIEIMRVHPVSPFGGPRCPTNDVTIDGFTIPKDTWVMPNVYAIHMNPDEFPNPTVFDPKRHIGANNDVVRPKNFMPFGMGRRMCMGKQVAENDLFLFTASILQNFRIKKMPGKTYSNIPDLSNDFNMVPEESYSYYIEAR